MGKLKFLAGKVWEIEKNVVLLLRESLGRDNFLNFSNFLKKLLE